jgi:hypothetical protein
VDTSFTRHVCAINSLVSDFVENSDTKVLGKAMLNNAFMNLNYLMLCIYREKYTYTISSTISRSQVRKKISDI